MFKFKGGSLLCSDEPVSPVGWDDPACWWLGTVKGEKQLQAARLAPTLGFFGLDL